MNPLLLDVASSFHTERLTIRCAEPGDGAKYHAAMDETFEQIQQWFGPWAKEPKSAEEVETLVREAQIEFLQRKTFTFLCFDKATDQFVGRAFLSRIDWDVPKGMFGYWTTQSLQGKSYGAEVVAAVTRFAFQELKFQRLELYIDTRNSVSIKFFEKCGFVLEGKLRNYGYDNLGVMKDYLVYSLLPDEFANSPMVSNIALAPSPQEPIAISLDLSTI